MRILVMMIGLALATLFTVCVSPEGVGVADLPNFTDIPSLIILLLLVIPVLISAGMFRDFWAAFGRAFSARMTCTRVELQRSMEAIKLARKSNYAAGLFGFLTAFIISCKRYGYDDAMNERIFWVYMAIAILPVFYAVVFDLIFLTVYGRLKKRYIDFMQTGYDMVEPETAVVVLDEDDVAEANQTAEREPETEQAQERDVHS